MCVSPSMDIYFLYFLDKYLGVHLLDHMIDVCLTFKETDKLFCRVVVEGKF